MLKNEFATLHHLAKNNSIRHYFDKVQWNTGNTYRIRVGHIFDPSKFWIIHLERELTLFQDFLNDFFKKNCAKYKMPSDIIEPNMYCVAFSEEGYYRSIIVDLPCTGTVKRTVLVFLFDFGFVVNVALDNLYFLPEKFYQTPRFAVRASLNRIQPRDGDCWKYNVVKRFNDLVSGKVLLCIVECADLGNKILFINIGSVNEQSSVVDDIGDVLLSEKLVRSVSSKRSHREHSKPGLAKTKYPWLFPSFDEIEQGIMPSSVRVLEMLKQCRSSQFLLKPYYYEEVKNVADSN